MMRRISQRNDAGRCRTTIAAVLAFGLAAASARTAQGEEQSYVLKGDELTVHLDASWAGGGQGGYFPVRIRVTNTGPSRELTFRFQPAKGHPLPTVKQTVQLDQNATIRFPLLIPMVGAGSAGTVEVLNGKKVIDDLKQDLRLPAVDVGGPGSPSVLVVSEGQVNLKPLERAANYLGLQVPRGYVSGSGTGSLALDAQSISPSSLPTSWIPYTTVDLVLIERDVLARLAAKRREALLHWVQCGGTLIVYRVGSGAAVLNELAKHLELSTHGAVSPRWEPADVSLRTTAATALANAVEIERANQGRIRFGPPRGRKPAVPSIVLPVKLPGAFNWPERGDAFFRRELMNGLIVAIPGDPFQASESDWAWLLQSIGSHRYQWGMRHGFSARKDSAEFQVFLIPGVQGVPVYAFLFLITAFTVLIGPLNYILLWKRKRLFLLVMTIPVIAFGTSVLLFGYSMVSHGFSVKSRARSLTILDQKSQDAVTVSRVALFAGMPPSGGLKFSNETAVFPIWPDDKEFENGTVDWSDGQTLAAGWLRSRTRTQFLTMNHRRERGRLEISGPVDGKLKVANGFEWEIEGLLVFDRNGKSYYAAGLHPGESTELSPPTKEDLQTFDALLRRFPLEAAEDSKPRRRRFGVFPMRRPFGYRHMETPIKYNDGLVERQIAQFKRIRLEGHTLAPSSYLAVFAENPGINLGVDRPTEFDGYHLLLGYY